MFLRGALVSEVRRFKVEVTRISDSVCVRYSVDSGLCCVDRIVTKASAECEAVTGNSLQRVITQLGDT